MVLLIDANVLLDVLSAREDFVEDSSKIWKLCETAGVSGYVSSLTLANIVYIMRKELSPEKIESVFQRLSLIFEIAPLNTSVLEKAVKMQWNDFEDAIQSVTAEEVNADFIVTRNVRDFTKSRIPAFTPTELLARI